MVTYLLGIRLPTQLRHQQRQRQLQQPLLHQHAVTKLKFKTNNFVLVGTDGALTSNARVRGSAFADYLKDQFTASVAGDCCHVCYDNGIKDLTHISYSAADEECKCYSIPGKLCPW